MGFDYVIIGNGPAGVGGVEGIRRLDAKGTLAVVGDEDTMPYTRCHLPGYISGRIPEKSLTYRPRSFYDRNQVVLFLGRRAMSLDPLGKSLLLDDGSLLSYGKLLLATGSSASLHELKGNRLPGVHALRTIVDARSISKKATGAKAAVVTGGGLVGIGVAIALHQRSIATHLVVASPQVLSQNVDRAAAELIEKHLRENGIDLLLDTDVVEVLGTDRASGVKLSDGRVLDCDLLVSAKGVRMNADLAVRAGLSVRRGVLVDDRLRTSSSDIYAAGDVAEVKSFLTGQSATFTLWPIASEQGRMAGMNMAGGDIVYPGGVQISSVEFLGMPLISIGESRESNDPAHMATVENRADKGVYRKVLSKEGRVIGAIMVGGLGGAGDPTSMPCTRIEVRVIRDLLLKDSLDLDKLAGTLLVKQPATGPR